VFSIIHRRYEAKQSSNTDLGGTHVTV
jgi:hypothetical protein